MRPNEIVIDSFAGGGGASTGIEAALGRPIDIAINHDPQALAMHRANHPETTHYCENVWDVDPVKACAGRPVGLAWFSPDCTYHSKARGGKPFRDRNRARRVRGLAWLIHRWAKAVRPRVIMMENVEEFANWGPLLEDGTPCPMRKGSTFQRWHRGLENLGYRVDMRELRACDYGAPTIRKRLFIIARRDDADIVIPEPTHGPGLLPYRTAAECIDWSIPCPSIFGRKRPLAENTMKRIAAGIQRYVLDSPNPFIVPDCEAAPFLTEHANASNQRNFAADEPLRTQCANVKGGHFALVTAFLAKHFTGVVGADLRDPMPTVTATDHNALVTAQLSTRDRSQQVRAFLCAYYGSDKDGQSLNDPMRTLTTKERFGLVAVAGVDYQIVDIGMRMLQPRELYRAQSFPDSYVIDPEFNGKPLTKTAQVRMCGNSVCPDVAKALVLANLVSERRQAATA